MRRASKFCAKPRSPFSEISHQESKTIGKPSNIVSWPECQPEFPSDGGDGDGGGGDGGDGGDGEVATGGGDGDGGGGVGGEGGVMSKVKVSKDRPVPRLTSAALQPDHAAPFHPSPYESYMLSVQVPGGTACVAE